MSERRYPLVPEEEREDYHIKPRLFWAHWHLAALTEPEHYPGWVRAHITGQFESLPGSLIECDPELLEGLVNVLEEKNLRSDIYAREAAALQ